MEKKITREPQYQGQVSLRDTKGFARLGLATNLAWEEDPRHLFFMLGRYKFVSKMLSGQKKVLEIGCGDAFETRIVLQEVGSVVAIDFDPIFVEDVMERMDDSWKFDCRVHDILSGPVEGKIDAAYCLDVFEHIPKKKEHRFMANISRSLKRNGVFIIGTPSLQSQVYASPANIGGHVNCKDHKQLKEVSLKYFHNVFIFSMNDEVVHTGFFPMAHYLFGVGVSLKKGDK